MASRMQTALFERQMLRSGAAAAFANFLGWRIGKFSILWRCVAAWYETMLTGQGLVIPESYRCHLSCVYRYVRAYLVANAGKDQLAKLVFRCWYIESHSSGPYVADGGCWANTLQRRYGNSGGFVEPGSCPSLERKVATGSADWSLWQDGQWFEEEGYYRKGPDGSFYRDERREHDEGYRIVV